MKKTFCLDTNILMYDPRAIFSFEDNNVVIPLAVLEELDRAKVRFDDGGRNARIACRFLDDLRQQGSLVDGVRTQNGGLVKVVASEYRHGNMPWELNEKNVDNLILSTAKKLQDALPDPVILITKDINLRIKCDVIGIKCEDYLKHRVASGRDLIYSGIQTIIVTSDQITEFYSNKEIDPSELSAELNLFENEFIIMRDGTSASALARFDSGMLKPIVKYRDVWGLQPRNKEQQFAFDALLNDEIKLCTMIGQAGTGKTLLAIAAGLKLTLEDKRYSKLIVTRPIQPVGRDIGYLPGTKFEKMEPWIQPIVDNLEYLFNFQKNSGSGSKSLIQMYFEKGIIEVEAITYIRGRSIPNAFVIIDEAQNLSADEVKTIITRAGEGTKITLTGDIQQIDNGLIDAVSNGLTYAVEKFKHSSIASHITMERGERSELATLASEIL